MYHFKLLLTFFLLIAGGNAQATQFKKPIVSLSFISWKEAVSLQGSGATDKAKSDLFGLALGVGIERYWHLRHGYEVDVQLMTGQTGVSSGSNNQVSYQVSGKNTWWGIGASARYSYRLSNVISLSLGPLLMDRHTTFSQGQTGSTVEAGPQVLFGGLAALRMRLFKGVELQQTIGTLAGKGSTIWSFGGGYRF
jgi:hypothetical protein